MAGLLRRGGQRKQWLDYLSEWSVKTITELVRLAQDGSASTIRLWSRPRSENEYGTLIDCVVVILVSGWESDQFSVPVNVWHDRT